MQWSLATPSALKSQFRANQGLVVANPICKCRWHKACDLQVQVAVGRRSSCVFKLLKETPLNKGSLGLPQNMRFFGPNVLFVLFRGKILAHRNRSDSCDLRLRCPSRTPEIAAISETRQSNAALRFKGAMESR